MVSPGISEAQQRSRSWLLLLLPALLAYRMPGIGSVFVDLQYLLIPVAALLGARFGLTGVISVAIGGLAFVVFIAGSGWGSIGGNPSLYLIALAVAALAASRQERLAWPQWPYRERGVAVLTIAAPVLLVLYLHVHGSSPSSSGAGLRFSFAPQLLAYFLLFVLGARGAKLWHLLAGLGVAAFASWSLVYVGLFPARNSIPQLDMLPLQPVQALAALVYFSAGATFRRSPDRPVARGWWRWPYLLAAVLLLVWLDPMPWLTSIRLDWTRLSVDFFRSPALLPIAAFMLGALRGSRGVWTAVALVTALVIAGLIGHGVEFEYFSTYSVQAGAPFIAYAYGRLGAYLTQPEAAEAANSRRRVRKTVTAWVLAAATTFGIMEDGGAVLVTLGIVFAVLFCAAYFYGRKIVRATAGSEREVSAQGWLSLLIAVCVILLVALNIRELAKEVASQVSGAAYVFQSLVQEAGQPGRSPAGKAADGLALVYVLVMAIGLIVVVSACRKALKDGRKVWRDLRIAYAYTKLVLSSRRTPPEDQTVPEKPAAAS